MLLDKEEKLETSSPLHRSDVTARVPMKFPVQFEIVFWVSRMRREACGVLVRFYRTEADRLFGGGPGCGGGGCRCRCV